MQRRLAHGPGRGAGHRGRQVVVGAVLVAALLLAGVWLVPPMMDWNRYREAIAALASQQLGRPVHIGGAVSLQLLPQPILTASDVSVEGGIADEHGMAPDGDAFGPGGIGLRARALRLRVALGPLLAGKVDARELTLQGADLRLPWPPPPGALGQRPPSWLTGLQARVEDGRLQVGQLVFTGFQGTVTTDPETGTLAAAGVLQAGDAAPADGGAGPPDGGAGAGAWRWQFTARLGRPGRDGSASLDVSLDGQGRLRDTGGTFTGQIGADGALSGRVAGRGPDLSQLMPAPALPWRTDGRLNAAGGIGVADELALVIGGAPATGAVSLRVQPTARLDVSITASRLDLDAWLPALLTRSGALRAGIPTGIDLSAEAATLAGGIVRRLRAGVDLSDGVVALRGVTAILPGEASLQLSGQVATGTATRFEGQVGLTAPDFRATLRWLQRVVPGATLPALPDAVLRTAQGTARLALASGQVAIADLEGTLDGSEVRGSASLQPGGPKARAALTLALTLDRLALDPWVPGAAAIEDGARRLWGPAGPVTVQAGVAVLRGTDLDVTIEAAQASLHGVALGPAALSVQSDVGRVLLRRLETGLAGADGPRIAVSGQLGEGGRLSDGRLELTAGEMGRLWPVLTALGLVDRAGAAGGMLTTLLRGPGRLQLLAAGPMDALAARATLEAGDLRIEAQPLLNLVARRWSGPVTLHHPGAPRLLAALGWPGAGPWLGDGSLSLLGQADVAPGRLALSGATLAAGSLRATGRVALEGRRVFGTVVFETLPLPGVDLRSTEPLPLGWMHGWRAALRIEAAQVVAGGMPVLQGLGADLTLADGVLTLAHAAARLGAGMLGGTVLLDATGERPRAELRLQAAGLALGGPLFGTAVDLVAGQAEAEGAWTATGFSPAALLATAEGRAALHVQAGIMAGFDLTAAAAALAVPEAQRAMAAARDAVLAGNTSFSLLDGSVVVARGIAVLDAALTGGAGTVRLGGSFDLQGGTLDGRLALRPELPDTAVEGPVLRLRVTGTGAAVLRTPELAPLARWLAERRPP